MLLTKGKYATHKILAMFLTFKISILDPLNEVDNGWLENNSQDQANHVSLSTLSKSPASMNSVPVIYLDELKIQHVDGNYFLVKGDKFIPVTNKQKLIVDNYCISIELNNHKIMAKNENEKSQGLFNFILNDGDVPMEKNQLDNKMFEPLFDNKDPLAFLNNSKIFSKS